MKKITILLACLLVLFYFGGCNKKGEINSSDVDLGYSITNKQYDNNKNNHIHIEYPIVTSETHSMEVPNQLITNGVKQYLTDYYDDSISELTLDLDYTIEFKNKNLLSISFKGLGNIASAAYPNNFMFTINIDMLNQKQLVLGDVYDLNMKFVEVYKGSFINQHPSNVEILNELELFKLVSKADLNHECFSLFTNDNLVISISVPHALGDYIETNIKYEVIKKYLKSNSQV